MNGYQDTAMDHMVKGWSRVDMLLAIYERSISTIRIAAQAKEANDDGLLTTNLLEANKLILALHAGLNTDEFELATNVARLLNFVALRLEQHNFEEAIYFLEKLHFGFSQIRDEANELEKSGKIPPWNATHEINAIA